MKQSKRYLFLLSLLCMSLSVLSQDIGINILQQPAVMPTNSTGEIQVDICNNTGTPGEKLPAYRIAPLISVPALVTITGVRDLPPGWFICSNDGNNIRLSNGSDGNLDFDECRTFYLQVKSGSTVGGPLNIQSTLAFGGSDGFAIQAYQPGTATGACNDANQTEGNNPGNDNSGTSVAVTLALPIGVTNFDAIWANKFGSITWKGTGVESPGTSYTIERSIDGRNFSSIGKLMANSITAIVDYKFVDKEVEAATFDNKVIYYRLKMTDVDGSIKYSTIRTLKRTASVSIIMSPNPVKDILYINGLPHGAKMAIVYNGVGQEIVRKTIVFNPTIIDFSKYASGVYTVKVLSTEGDVLQTSKIIK